MLKKTIEEIKEITKEFGYEVLSDRYTNAHTKYKFRCPKGHEFEKRWNDFRQGQRCPICSRKEGGLKHRKTIEEIRKEAEKYGYEVLSNKYRNIFTKYKLRCPEGHEIEVKWSDFSQGCRCPVCSGKKKKTIEEIKEIARKYGYEVLSNEYKDVFTKYKFRCPKGHKFEMRWNDFHQGCRCPTCSKNRKLEEIKEIARKCGYEVLSREYISCSTRLKTKCSKGHEFGLRPDIFRRGSRCPTCADEEQSKRMRNGGAAHALSFIKNPSRPQVELFDITCGICPYVILNYPCVSLNYSIDIAVPQLSLAIEYDGSYYHQDSKVDQKRQKELEEEGWTFLRYRDYVPGKEELKADIEKTIYSRNSLKEDLQK